MTSEKTSVKIFHLISGAPIIAKYTITESTPNGQLYHLEDPLYIVYDATSREEDVKGNGGSFAINDLLILSDENEVTIREDRIMFAYPPSAPLLDHYNTFILNRLHPIPESDSE